MESKYSICLCAVLCRQRPKREAGGGEGAGLAVARWEDISRCARKTILINFDKLGWNHILAPKEVVFLNKQNDDTVNPVFMVLYVLRFLKVNLVHLEAFSSVQTEHLNFTSYNSSTFCPDRIPLLRRGVRPYGGRPHSLHHVRGFCSLRKR